MPHPPDALGERLRALPDFDPPAAGWTRLATALHPPRRRAWLPPALAAGLAMLGLVLLMRGSPLAEGGADARSAPVPPVAEAPQPSEADVALLLAAHGDDRDLLFAALHRLAPVGQDLLLSTQRALRADEGSPDDETEEEWI